MSQGSGRAAIDPAARRQGGPTDAKVQAARILRGKAVSHRGLDLWAVDATMNTWRLRL